MNTTAAAANLGRGRHVDDLPRLAKRSAKSAAFFPSSGRLINRVMVRLSITAVERRASCEKSANARIRICDGALPNASRPGLFLAGMPTMGFQRGLASGGRRFFWTRPRESCPNLSISGLSHLSTTTAYCKQPSAARRTCQKTKQNSILDRFGYPQTPDSHVPQSWLAISRVLSRHRL
jgi:hypothetical protein